MVTIRTTSLTLTNSTFCSNSACMCFVWISEQTAIISLYSINWLVFITETECVYCAVRTGSLYIIQVVFLYFKSNVKAGDTFNYHCSLRIWPVNNSVRQLVLKLTANDSLSRTIFVLTGTVKLMGWAYKRATLLWNPILNFRSSDGQPQIAAERENLISEHLKCGHCRFIIVLTSRINFEFYDFMGPAQ